MPDHQAQTICSLFVDGKDFHAFLERRCQLSSRISWNWCHFKQQLPQLPGRCIAQIFQGGLAQFSMGTNFWEYWVQPHDDRGWSLSQDICKRLSATPLTDIAIVCVCGCHISISYIPMGLGCSIHWYFSDWIPIFLVYEDPCSLVIHRSSPRVMVSTSPVSLRSLIAWRPGCSTNSPLCKKYVARWTLVVLWRYLNWLKEEHPGIIMNLYESNISKSPERKSQQVTSPITWPPEYHVFFDARSVENHRERLICGICLSQRS